MIQLNYPYKCRHCSVVYVILQGHTKFSFLPVELINGSEKEDLEFDKHKHVSHLTNCSKLQNQWEGVKKNIVHQMNKVNYEETKWLMK